MSNTLNNIKDTVKDKVKPGTKGEQGGPHTEQQFTTQPHPAKTNDPRDLEGPQLGAGLTNKPEISAHHAHGPQIISEDQANSLEKPASREELHRRAAELNK